MTILLAALPHLNYKLYILTAVYIVATLRLQIPYW